MATHSRVPLLRLINPSDEEKTVFVNSYWSKHDRKLRFTRDHWRRPPDPSRTRN